mmetsp:Transcript_40145/g.113690  ORF Transcript_40145/g.113690 Transcript_40145/m.113690 type:complete len:222 (+) Transcript_40145:131-796(+)
MGRGRNDGRAARRKELRANKDPLAQRAAAAFGSTAMPAEVSPVEASIFYQLVASQSWEEVEGKIQQVVDRGLLTEGVLLAGLSILDKAKHVREDTKTIASLTKVCERLTEILTAMQMPGAIRLMEEWAAMLEGKTADEEQLRKAMDEEFERGSTCTRADFCKEMESVMEKIKEQDKQFDASVKKMEDIGQGLPRTELEETRQARANARGHVETIIRLAGRQ